MRPFRKVRAAFLYGRANARFYQGRYQEAARLLERLHELDPEGDFFCRLGRCYLFLGRYKDALDQLSRAYESICKQGYIPKSEFERQGLLEFLIAFRDALQKSGQSDRAQEIARLVDEWSRQAVPPRGKTDKLLFRLLFRRKAQRG